MVSGPSEKDRATRLSTELFLRIELVVYVALGTLLSVTALPALASAAHLLWEGDARLERHQRYIPQRRSIDVRTYAD
jgi:hypothetical protein